MLITGMLAGCSPSKEVVDLMVTNGVIYTVDDSFSVAGSMVINDGIIIATGTAKELAERYEAVKVLDAKGNFIYPGFYDSHCHFYHYGAGLATRVDLTGTSSFAEVLKRMQEFALTRPEGWLAGRGWDQNQWPEKKFPDNTELNRLFPDRPVILIRIDGHAVLVNDLALKAAGVSASTKIDGGEILLHNGKPTGILIDKAADILKEIFLKETTGGTAGEEELIRGILQGQKNCFAVGITTVADAGLEYNEVSMIDKLQQEQQLKMKVYGMLSWSPDNLTHYISKGPYRTDLLHLRSVKFYADGALGSRGALLLEPYSDRPGYSGILTMNPDTFTRQCADALKFGYQVNTHAIGDSANRLVLQTYGKVLKGPNDLRWRIEHAQVVHPDDLRKFRDFSIIPSVNTTHATSDMPWAHERLGSQRVRSAYAYHNLLQTNGWLCNGSDFPVEQINPLLGFYAGVARQDLSGNPPEGWQPENALSRQEALKAMTFWAAKACFEEKTKGSLQKGKAADFVILDQDIMKAPLIQIPKIRVISTWINGEKVF